MMPIFGIGAVGWLCLPVLAVLVAVALTGYDLQEAYLRAIGRTFGPDTLMWYVASVHAGLALRLGGAHLNFVDMIPLTVALSLCGRRVARWAIASMAAWIMVSSSLAYGTWLAGCLLDLFPSSDFLFPSSDFRAFSEFRVAWWSTNLLPPALILIGLTRSWRIAIATAIWSGIVLCVDATELRAQLLPASGWVLIWSWHAGFAVIVLSWAISHRRNLPSIAGCPVCGYDLQAHLPSASKTCPECGRATASS